MDSSPPDRDSSRSDGPAPPHDAAKPSPDVTPPHDAAVPSPDVAPPVSCTGTYAYLHGDLWPMWYNMRVCCDGEHRALWRCQRVHGAGAAACAALKTHYQSCLSSPNSDVCPNWGVCCFKASNGCEQPDAEHLKVCDTRNINYDDPAVWGTYYGYQWASSTTKHRFMTLFAWDAAGTRIAAFSSNPGESDAYMGGTQNYGIGPQPQGAVELIKDKYNDRFGAFACVRLPAGKPLTLQAIWMNDFCHTCSTSYWSYPNTPCRTDKIPITLQPGRHYLWTHEGLVKLPGCSGPPPAVGKWLPQASCSTQS